MDRNGRLENQKDFEDYVITWHAEGQKYLAHHGIPSHQELAKKKWHLPKTSSPHTFRILYTCEGGANLRAIHKMSSGHESIATTEIYTHIDRHRLQ